MFQPNAIADKHESSEILLATGDNSPSVGRRRFLQGGAAVAGAALATCVASEAEAAPTALKQQMALVRRHENDHVAYLVTALGAMARPKPTFQNLVRANVNYFLGVALALENTGVGAYLGAVPAILTAASCPRPVRWRSSRRGMRDSSTASARDR